MKQILLVGCPICNRTRTRVAKDLVLEKASQVVGYVAQVFATYSDNEGVADVRFLASDGKFAENEVFRHDVNPILRQCWGDRTAAELDKTRDTIQLYIAFPFQDATGREMQVVSMVDELCEATIAKAGDIARKNRGLAVQMCKKLMVGKAAHILPHFAIANMAICVALALHLENNPNLLLLDFLQVSDSWSFLAQFLRKEVGKEYENRLVIVPKEVRQPWAY